MHYTLDEHRNGLVLLMTQRDRNRAKRLWSTEKGRAKFRARMCHRFEPAEEFIEEPPKGARDAEALIATLTGMGADSECYVLSADGVFDDSLQSLEAMVRDADWQFTHEVMLSCIPGRLALFRPAAPGHDLIVRR